MDAFPLLSMTPYRNRSGNSGVAAFALLADGIVVEFHGGATYLYGPNHPGADHVAAMKRRAFAGRGLSSYISQHVGDDYEAQLR